VTGSLSGNSGKERKKKRKGNVKKTRGSKRGKSEKREKSLVRDLYTRFLMAASIQKRLESFGLNGGGLKKQQRKKIEDFSKNFNKKLAVEKKIGPR